MDESQEPQDESVNPEGNPSEGAPPEGADAANQAASDQSGEDQAPNADDSGGPDDSASESAAAGDEKIDETMIDGSEKSDVSSADMSSIQMPDVSDDAPRAEFGPLPASGAVSDKQAGNISMLLDVKLPVSIELGRTKMSIGEVLELGSGSIIELDKLAGEPVDILVNGKPLAKGEVVVLDENFGVRITNLISQRECIERLNNQ